MRRWLARVFGSKRPRFEARVVGHEAPFANLEVIGDVGPKRFEVARRTTVTFRAAHVQGVDFSRQIIDNWGAFGSDFEHCDFTGATFRGGLLGHLPQVTYRSCRFADADLRDASPLWGRFEECDFSGAQLADWDAGGAEFVSCVFTGRLVRVKFAGKPWSDRKARYQPPRTSNAFVGNDFSRADLIDCSFSGGIRLSANKMPTGPDYLLILNAVRKLEAIREQVSSWPDGSRKTDALIWLDVYSKWNYEGQDELILRKDEIAPGIQELLEAA